MGLMEPQLTGVSRGWIRAFFPETAQIDLAFVEPRIVRLAKQICLFAQVPADTTDHDVDTPRDRKRVGVTG
jgi:hypothetical protein